MYEKIIVSIDGSDHAKHALNYALESAAKRGAELVSLKVVPPISSLTYFGEFSAQYIRDLMDNLRESHQKILSDAANIVKNKKPSLKFQTRLEEGRTSDVIVDIAKEEDVDLIIMGSRGMGGIVGFLGSTSRHVVEACTKPILIVK